MASAVLLALCFPPFDFFFPPFVALIPLIQFIDDEPSDRRAVAGTALMGIFFWCCLLYWITIFTRVGYLVVALVMSLSLVAFTLTVRHLKRRFGLPLVFSVPVVWTAASYVHAHGDLAFPWGQLAYSLADWPFWLQLASVAGPYGVSAWIVTINVVLYELVLHRGGRKRSLRYGAALVLLIAVPALFGAWRYRAYDRIAARAPRLTVSYIQPSMPQEIKWLPEVRDSTFALLRDLSLEQAGRRPDLVVWPEAAAPAHLRIEKPYQRFVGDVARRLGCHLLTGSPEYRWDSLTSAYESYNSAFFFDPSGRILDSYDKIHLVPVSERFPWEDIFPALREIEVGGSHFMPGDRYTVFRFDEEAFSVLICFESIFPDMSRKFVRNGARFLVNITNDAWFERTSAARQHSNFLVLRAIEEGRDIVRSANTGVSAFYDRLGRRRGATDLFERTSTTDTIHTYGDLTVYARLGDWPAHIAWVTTLALLGWSMIFRRKRVDRAG